MFVSKLASVGFLMIDKFVDFNKVIVTSIKCLEWRKIYMHSGDEKKNTDPP